MLQLIKVLHLTGGYHIGGGISRSNYLTDKVKEMTEFIAPVQIMAGEFEMEALAAGAIRVMTGQEEEKEYTGVPVWNGFKGAKRK